MHSYQMHQHHEHIKFIMGMVEEAASNLQKNPGCRVAVTCSSGAAIEGLWIDRGNISVNQGGGSATLYDERNGETIITQIDVEAIAAVAIIRPKTVPTNPYTQVPPSHLEMTCASILMEIWGRMGHGPSATYGDLRQALDEIDGSGASLGGAPAADKQSLDAVHVGMMPHVEKVLQVLAKNRLLESNKDYGFLAMDMFEVLDECGEQARDLFKEVKSAGFTKSHEPILMGDVAPERKRVRELPSEIQTKLLIAFARERMKQIYHPFMVRDILISMAHSIS